MIPLIKPLIPHMESVCRYFRQSEYDYKLANFGPCYDEAVRRLEALVPGRYFTICSSGTSAIRTAIATTMEERTEVICPSYTHMGTWCAAKEAGCTVIPGDCDPRTWTVVPYMSWEQVIVSPFGYEVDVKGFDKGAKKIVYDFAGAWGYFPKTRYPVCYSLHATKNFSCGEGGLISWATEHEAERARRFTNFNLKADRTSSSLLGTNCKPSEILCATILAMLDRHDDILRRIEHKKRLMDLYRNELNLYAPKAVAPSLCVFEGLPSDLEVISPDLGFISRSYYKPLPYEQDINRIALPSDCNLEDAHMVCKKIRALSW